jgi:hypothetical protein
VYIFTGEGKMYGQTKIHGKTKKYGNAKKNEGVKNRFLKERRLTGRKLAAVILALITVISLAGCGKGSRGKDLQDSASTQSAENGNSSSFRQESPGPLSGDQISENPNREDSDNEYLRPEPGCSFWTLTFEIENLGEEDSQISVSDFCCYADGQSCSRRLFRDDYLSADIAGGRKAKGTVTFEVPDEAQVVEAEYKTGRRADARVVFTMR